MNYEKFYKMAEETAPPTTETEEKKDETPKDEGPKWNERIGNVYGWNEQLPMLSLLAGTGALGGWALSSKKKKGAGAAYGAISLPALYAAYIASRRNGILPSDKDDFLDKGFNKINDTVNPYLPKWFQQQKKV